MRYEAPRTATETKKFRVEFFTPNKNQATAADVPWTRLGHTILLLSKAHWNDVIGIAFKRAAPVCLTAEKVTIYEL